MSLHRFHGGLRLPARKIAATRPIQPCPLPAELVMSLAQHAGAAARPVVRVGQTVRRGECIAQATDGLSASVHAGSSGRILAIEDRPVPHASGLAAQCIVIQTDGRDDWLRLPALPIETPRHALLDRLADCGVVGLGGAAFPTATKLVPVCETLVINAAECEPHIACDDGLLRERADAVVAGVQWLQRICAASRVLIAIEDAMTDATLALTRAVQRCADPRLQVSEVPTIYPQGGERQLIRVLTGHEVPAGGLPQDIGILCHNVATAYAVSRAIEYGEALTSRIVSVSGAGIGSPGNFDVHLGTSLEFLIAHAGGYGPDAARLVMGGPMMGIALPHDGVPVVKACNSVLVLGAGEIRRSAPEMPCIRCGECVRVCPAQLMPQQLFDAIRLDDWQQTERLALSVCIECGCCAQVCPSQIPLVDWYRHGKSEIAIAQRRDTQANTARIRYEARNIRLAREQAERVARISDRAVVPVAPRAEATTLDTPSLTVAATSPPMDKSAVLAAIARGRARKQARDAETKPPAQPPDDSSA
ncbi:MAG: electron transport complex subunit RsxC [Tahibacter sp.]